MKTWIIRGITLLVGLTFGWVLYKLLAPLGYAWVVWTLAALSVGFFVLETVLRHRKRTAERTAWARWQNALLDPAARRKAILEVRRELARARRLGPRLRVRQARLSVALANLELGEGRSEDAIATLSKLDVSKLEPQQAVVVRIARAQAYLHGDDIDGAAATLSPLTDDTTGDAVLDASVTLARAAIAVEEGALDDASTAAARILGLAAKDDELWDEAKALEAVCLDARGEPHQAALREIAEPGRARLAALGSARLRGLLEPLDA